jgi:hypothetical protein
MTTTLKTQPRDDSVDDFIASWPNGQAEEGRVLCDALSRATGEPPKRWGTKLIGFGTYTYRYASGRSATWMPIAFAPRKGGFTLYLVDDQELYKERLSDMAVKGGGKSCVYLKVLSEIDLEILCSVVSDSYKSTINKHKNL